MTLDACSVKLKLRSIDVAIAIAIDLRLESAVGLQVSSYLLRLALHLALGLRLSELESHLEGRSVSSEDGSDKLFQALKQPDLTFSVLRFVFR